MHTIDLVAVAILACVVAIPLGLLVFLRKQSSLVRAWRAGSKALGARKHADAETFFRKSLAMAEKRHGPRHWRTAFHLAALGEAVAHQNRFDEAAELIERATTMHDAMAVQPSKQWPWILIHASRYERLRGRVPEATALLERAESEADGSAMRAAVVRETVDHWTRQRRWAEACDAITTMPWGWGRGQKADVRLLAQVALECRRTGDMERACRCFARAVEACASCGGRRHTVAFYRGLLGDALASAGRYAEAMSELRLAIRAYERRLGPLHPALAPPMVALAEVLVRLAAHDDARGICTRVLGMPWMREPSVEAPYRTDSGARDPRGELRRRALTVLSRLASAKAA
jgi:tetratricopeptide (TPR) repeat protein